VALALAVALPNAVLAVLALRGDARTGTVSTLAGGGLVLWIAVQLAFIRELSPFHPFYVAVGLLQVWLGARLRPGRAAAGGSRRRAAPRSPAAP
jgi:hypothetical protein